MPYRASMHSIDPNDRYSILAGLSESLLENNFYIRRYRLLEFLLDNLYANRTWYAPTTGSVYIQIVNFRTSIQS